MPRTSDGLFPRDFAKREIAEYLDEFKPAITTFRSKWDHGTLERKEAFRLLLEKREELYEKLNADGENLYVNTSKEKDELISGLFLVRLSERNNGYVITMLHNDEVKNYKIEKIVSHQPWLGFCLDRIGAILHLSRLSGISYFFSKAKILFL